MSKMYFMYNLVILCNINLNKIYYIYITYSFDAFSNKLYFYKHIF